MSLNIEVEELWLSKQNDYLAVVRINRYEGRRKSLGGVEWTQPEKAETLAEFTVRVPRKPHGKQRKERPIEDIERDATLAVLSLCQEVVKLLQPGQETRK